MKPGGAWAVAMVVATFTGIGCNSVATESVPNTQGTDRLWASANTYCARTTNGLICWEAESGNVAAREPTVFDGIGKVTALYLRKGEGCAVSDLGMGCFRLSDKQLARGGGDVPTDFVAFGAAKTTYCARGTDGVRCFVDKIEDIKPVAAFEKPAQLHPTLRGNGACAEYEYELRCFTTDAEGKLLATVRLRGVRGAKAIRIDEEKGWVLVLDGSGLKFSTVNAEVARGRPVTEDSAKNFPDAVAVELAAVEGVKGAKKLTADSTSTYVLDEEGVKSIALSEKGLEVQLWPLSFKPEDFWQGKGSVFFAAHEGELSMHGYKSGERYGKALRGVKNPKDVAAGELYTCVVHESGISCVQNLLD